MSIWLGCTKAGYRVMAVFAQRGGASCKGVFLTLRRFRDGAAAPPDMRTAYASLFVSGFVGTVNKTADRLRGTALLQPSPRSNAETM
jgi:hypothetical protein